MLSTWYKSPQNTILCGHRQWSGRLNKTCRGLCCRERVKWCRGVKKQTISRWEKRKEKQFLPVRCYLLVPPRVNVNSRMNRFHQISTKVISNALILLPKLSQTRVQNRRETLTVLKKQRMEIHGKKLEPISKLVTTDYITNFNGKTKVMRTHSWTYWVKSRTTGVTESTEELVTHYETNRFWTHFL